MTPRCLRGTAREVGPDGLDWPCAGLPRGGWGGVSGGCGSRLLETADPTPASESRDSDDWIQVSSRPCSGLGSPGPATREACCAPRVCGRGLGRSRSRARTRPRRVDTGLPDPSPICFAAYCARSTDELSGRTTGRLGYDRPKCHRRDGRAGATILKLVSASDDRTKALISDYGGNAAASARAAGPFCGTTGRRKQRVVAAELSVPRDLPKNYGPTGSSGRRRRLRRGRST